MASLQDAVYASLQDAEYASLQDAEYASLQDAEYASLQDAGKVSLIDEILILKGSNVNSPGRNPGLMTEGISDPEGVAQYHGKKYRFRGNESPGQRHFI